jgi:hypothetical protein
MFEMRLYSGCRHIVFVLVFLFSTALNAKSVFTVDTMTYSINLDIPENAHMKVLPELILKSYIKGKIRAYYPKRELNEILLDDLLAHYGKANFQCGPSFCWEDYANHPYLQELYDKFKKELRFKEIIYYDAQHAVVKREIAWIQLMYTDMDITGEWKTNGGPKFWMLELDRDKSLRVSNPLNASMSLSIQQEFDARHFVPNEIGKEMIKQKSGKLDNANEN